MLIYLGGPMRGYEGYNSDEFDRVEELLTQAGHRVLSPSKTDREMLEHNTGLSWWPDDTDYSTFPSKYLGSLSETMIVCLEAISCCDAVAMLDGWERSAGCQVEEHFARFLGIQCSGWRDFVEVVA